MCCRQLWRKTFTETTILQYISIAWGFSICFSIGSWISEQAILWDWYILPYIVENIETPTRNPYSFGLSRGVGTSFLARTTKAKHSKTSLLTRDTIFGESNATANCKCHIHTNATPSILTPHFTTTKLSNSNKMETEEHNHKVGMVYKKRKHTGGKPGCMFSHTHREAYEQKITNMDATGK